MISKKSGTRCKEIDEAMHQRNKNKRNTTIYNNRTEKNEISRKNLILGKRMQEIFNRKKSNYGELQQIEYEIGTSSQRSLTTTNVKQ